VVQGAEYFNEVMTSLESSYGAARNLDDFCNKVYAMNYNSARGMFEAYGREKYEATGITTWKYDAAWPAAFTWQYVDWYLRPTAALFGAKKACEPLHVQYAYDDGGVYVVNSFYEPFQNLTVKAALYDFNMNPKFSREETVAVEPDGKTLAFAVDTPEGLSTAYFLKLELRDESGALRSQNFYWLSTTPDVPGTTRENLKGEFLAKPKSRADFTALNDLPPVKLDVATSVEKAADTAEISVTLKNPTANLAFLIQLAVTRNGVEIGPSYWEDNYFSLLPGEERVVSATAPLAELGDAAPAVRVTGWNVVD
jgi:exo-1,4-beta-D-glucosaminidase